MQFKFRFKVTPEASFNSLVMKQKVNKFERRWLIKIGATIRTFSMRSMRRRKGSSPPGKPPHAHHGALRKLIIFALTNGDQDVIVGPMLFKSSTNDYNLPNLHEFGGMVMRKVTGRKGSRSSKPVRYPKRPYMKPALIPAIEFLRKKGEIPKIFAKAVF